MSMKEHASSSICTILNRSNLVVRTQLDLEVIYRPLANPTGKIVLQVTFTIVLLSLIVCNVNPEELHVSIDL